MHPSESSSGDPIGANQGVQFPLAQALRSAGGGAPDALGKRRRSSMPAGEQPGFESGTAAGLLRVYQATWAAAQRRDGLHTAATDLAEEYGIERKFRESRLFMVAPIANNLVLAFIGHNVLGMPKSY